MNREEAIENLKGLLESNYVDSFEDAENEALDIAIKALEQEPRKITLEDVKGYCKPRYLTIISKELLNELTHPKIKALEQEPCEMTAEEYRQRMIQAFHNADTDELIAICVLPTEKEFEHLEWLLKNHYKKEPCCNAIDRAEAIKAASGYCHPANVAKELAKLPSVNPQPCEDAISRQAVLDMATTIQTDDYSGNEIIEVVDVDDVKALPPVTPQPKTGHWIQEKSVLICSICDARVARYDKYSYCPSCGAKMVEPQEGDKCSKCKYHINPDYTRCKECGAERSDKK